MARPLGPYWQDVTPVARAIAAGFSDTVPAAIDLLDPPTGEGEGGMTPPEAGLLAEGGQVLASEGGIGLILE